MSTYKLITVRDLVNFVATMPKGLDTPIYSGDFEGNYTHGMHEIMVCTPDEKVRDKSVFIGYEMHESIYND